MVDFPAYIIDKGPVFAFTFAFAAIALWNLLLYLFGLRQMPRCLLPDDILAWPILQAVGAGWRGWCATCGSSVRNGRAPMRTAMPTRVAGRCSWTR